MTTASGGSSDSSPAATAEDRRGGAVAGGYQELILGSSFDLNPTDAYHSVRFDFKPASLDFGQTSNLNVSKNKEVAITMPDAFDGSKAIFRGNQKPCHKECILLINKQTGEFRLEKFSSCIQLKKTRDQPIGGGGAERGEVQSSQQSVSAAADAVPPPPPPDVPLPKKSATVTQLLRNESAKRSKLDQFLDDPKPPPAISQRNKQREKICSTAAVAAAAEKRKKTHRLAKGDPLSSSSVQKDELPSSLTKEQQPAHSSSVMGGTPTKTSDYVDALNELVGFNDSFGSISQVERTDSVSTAHIAQPGAAPTSSGASVVAHSPPRASSDFNQLSEDLQLSESGSSSSSSSSGSDSDSD